MSKKKPAPKKAAKEISKDVLAAVVKRLESGQSKLIAESKKLGLTPNTPLRNALTRHLGGKQQYTAMIQRGMKARGKNKEEPQGRLKQAA